MLIIHSQLMSNHIKSVDWVIVVGVYTTKDSIETASEFIANFLISSFFILLPGFSV